MKKIFSLIGLFLILTGCASTNHHCAKGTLDAYGNRHASFSDIFPNGKLSDLEEK